jgi:predicted transcriptional regulator of viral defense system
VSARGRVALDRALSRLAERQHGVVTRRQLLKLGITPRTVDYRIEHARLHPVHHGVYAVGHPGLTAHGRWTAAVLAHGPTAVLSHRSAASLWGVLRSVRTIIEVTAPRRWSRLGVKLHRSCLRGDEVTVKDGIPVTSVPRTLFDLARVLRPQALERAIGQAEALRLTDPLSLPDLLERHRGCRGAATLRAVLADGRTEPTVTRSDLEDLFLTFLDAHGLPRPQVNVGIEARGRWMECDFVWRTHRLIVELDGRETHNTGAAFERDRARDRALQVSGWRVVRITWRQLHADGDRIAADLRDLLGRRYPEGVW